MYFNFIFSFFSKTQQGKLLGFTRIHCTYSHGYFIFIFMWLLFLLPFSPVKIVSNKAVWYRDSVARELESWWLMLPGRMQRWAPDYRRESFFILLESKSSFYTDDKLTNSVGIRFQKEIWNFNMFSQRNTNPKIFLLNEWDGIFFFFFFKAVWQESFGLLNRAISFNSITDVKGYHFNKQQGIF